MIEITDEEAQKAVDYLVNSAKDYAKWYSRMNFLDKNRKVVRAIAILKATGKTISENTIRGEASEDYQNALKELEEAKYEYMLIHSYRAAAETKIDLWRSINASLRRGNI